VPGKPEESELFKRLVAEEKSRRMPPAKTNKRLSKEQIDLFAAWIKQGGKYQNHWSLIPPVRAEMPRPKDAVRARNPIDTFILGRLDKEGLTPSPEADPRTLFRRLSFDLTGLPPAPKDVDAFVKEYGSASPPAKDKIYAQLVERLLASQHYGERMAQYWLDLVRYADTGGYHSDNHREVALYRDWVIDAFNRNVPFDRFTVEQLAGDLLPGATQQQKIASGYNRLLQTTEEGGAQAKEYQAKYYADRVRNFSTVWLGLTVGCAECHDHKYDQLGTKDFYRTAAFFADIQERSVGRQEQTPVMTPEQAAQIKKYDDEIAALSKTLNAPEALDAQAKWEQELQAKGVKGLPANIVTLLKLDAPKRNAKQKEAVAVYFRSITPELKKANDELQTVQKQKAEHSKSIRTTLVAMAGAPRTIRVLPRGNWLDDSGEVVLPAAPAALPGLKFDDAKKRADRHDLAKWVVSPDNPLTSRVMVNRLWMLFFGQGIVKTLDDFGAQGTWPTHPELLDWLALEFMSATDGRLRLSATGVAPDNGKLDGFAKPQAAAWDIKRLIRLMVTSSTYKQSSVPTPELRQRDPYNQLLARQGRFRIDAEFVRDNALTISGLIVHKVGGDSVKPYQPAGYWRYLNFPVREWQHDKDADQYRRGLYTYWQRTFLQPSLLAFDAPSREECTVERARSNTPQQALVLLNDPSYVEAARTFAERVIKSGKDVGGRIDFAFREALQRQPSPQERKVLADLLHEHLAHYRANPSAAEALRKVGERPAAKDLLPIEVAAWTSVTRTILNLHETITRN
jgi:hypothetical protein